MSTLPMSAPAAPSTSPHHKPSGPGLYEFLIEAELQHYYSGIKNTLKIQNVSQLKYVTEDDLNQIGMAKPEMRRLKKFFHKHYPQNYLSKFKKMILHKKEEHNRPGLSLPDERLERPPVKVPNKHIIPAEAIIVNKELGTGEFGVVQQGVWSNDGERIQVAIKCLSRERMQNNPIEFLKEAGIMHSIDHEHVVRLYGVVLDTDSLMLVTELAPLRSLLECLKEPSLRSSFPVLTLCDFAVQICDGMQYLEMKRLIHRDLAARNILVFSKNKVKISDFGLSRALGVGKDYYQTNFNVNLKLPIAWCAPECITFLRFTSASDVWAYGVTLWEMFSYGFQPWAALTGQQILEAIDEPSCQRLEQPDCCPRDYYGLMLKCWHHDPVMRPKFSDLISLLPECKPEQVQAAQDSPAVGKVKRDHLSFKMGDIITVLDKGSSGTWKGVLHNGKAGSFNPAFTVAYLGLNLPSNKNEFTRGDGKNTYSSKRKLRTDMISAPQGDVKHMGHVGMDGAYFGDISFLGGKSNASTSSHSLQYPHLPRQVVTPYKPSLDQPGPSHTRNPSDSSDRAPLLLSTKGMPTNSGSDWSDSASATPIIGKGGKFLMDHEYHEISDEETVAESPRFESFDFGPSLLDEMDAMFKSFGSPSKQHESPPSSPLTKAPPPPLEVEESRDVAHNVRNELREIAARVTGGSGKKKQATVKPISAADQRTLESAIALANELASRSMQELDGCEVSPPPESPHTPLSPNKRKFSFKLPSNKSPKPERRNFAEEAASIPDIQETLTEEAKTAYNLLVESSGTASTSVAGSAPSVLSDDDNPLRMLRSGMAVRPRVRGNKQRHLQERQASSEWPPAQSSRSLPRPRTNSHPQQIPVPVSRRRSEAPLGPPPPVPLDSRSASEESLNHHSEGEFREDLNANPIPLPPRDPNTQLTNKPRHQRKHPLVIPGFKGKLPVVDCSHLTEPKSPSQFSDTSSDGGGNAVRYNMLDDSFDNQIANELAALDNIPEEESSNQPSSPTSSPARPSQPPPPPPPPPLAEPEDELDEDEEEDPLLRNGDHVSCEDLLEFACDGPNVRRTQGPTHGPQSDEVRIMCKVLGTEVAAKDCVMALDVAKWDVHRAIKVAKLQAILGERKTEMLVAYEALQQSNWDVARAADWVLNGDDSDHATEV
ncbi:activated Cdc42 kinase-like isoform X3 [Neocloeon triangulifer]|uniref:activated Cdc42 kinase-like isoform X3 n=1 Tax=Neocloeon triangulifer TaxID=2078957 RepID=UPI00286EC306|nr:activated Cdc42 kinase-like isoform X3 [Neocloeon triangulifer]